MSDDKIGPIACPQTTLAAGESMTCTAVTGVVLPGQYVNVATVTGVRRPPPGQVPNGATVNGLTLQGELVSDSEPSHHFGAVAGIDIEKATNGVDADTQSPQNLIPVGTAVTWTYVVTNTGNLTLTNVAVTDDVRGLICVIGTLAPGASTTCSDSSVAVAGLYVNVGHVRRDSAIGHRTDSDPSHYCGIAVGGGGTSITATPTATATPFLRPPRPAHHRRGRRNPPPRAHRRAQPRSHQTQGADWPSVHPSGIAAVLALLVLSGLLGAVGAARRRLR